MAKSHSRTFVWDFDAPPEEVWPFLADTARFNEAAGLPNHVIEETPQPDGSVDFRGRARMGPFELAWQEKPTNWVAAQWFEHCRVFERGPLDRLCAVLRLTPTPEGCRVEYHLEASAKGLLGEALLRGGFFRSTGQSFGRQAAHLGGFLNGGRAMPFDYTAAPVTEAVRARVDAIVARLEENEHGRAHGRRLADYVLGAQEVDLVRLRPLRLARLWGLGERVAIELCLEATRAGLLELRWDLLCPRCRVAKLVVGSLDQLPEGAHCTTCNIDYGRDFSRNVELSFHPAPGIRPLNTGEYCLFGPMSTPHVRVHVTLEPGESRRLAAKLPPGAYRLRTQEPGPELDMETPDGAFPEVVLEPEAVTAGAAAAPGELRLSNRMPWRRTLVIEEREWVRDALTADRASSLQAFRDLFSDQVLRPGDEVAVKRIALMFTDLRGSTALYRSIGDARAYRLVREHFALLAAKVRDRDGAIVKTIGDAVMAAFIRPADALAAALEIQREVEAFNEGRPETPIRVKLGLHEGPCIAVTLNDRLDYFGSTVNLAARLQGESQGGDIVLSRSMAEDPAVAELIAELAPCEEEARLKGYDRPVGFLRLRT